MRRMIAWSGFKLMLALLVCMLGASVSPGALAFGQQSDDFRIEKDAAVSDASQEQVEIDKYVEGGGISWGVTYAPVRNTTTVRLTVPEAGEIVSTSEADTLHIKATMSYGGATTRTVERRIALSDLVDSEASIDFGDFGKFAVESTYEFGGKTVKSLPKQTVGVTADTYNISPVSATLPVTFFSLNLWGENNIRTSGPVILLMERPNAYSWDDLPKPGDGVYGMYGLPYLTKQQVSYQPGSYGGASDQFRSYIPVMAAYVHDLMELDPSSRINLYCVDFYLGMIQQIIYANKVPEGQYRITMMSDGTFSYNKFTSTYTGSNPAAKHEQLVEEWEAAKARAYQTGKADGAMSNWSSANKYLWAMTDSEPDAQWWVARKDLVVTEGDGNAFGKEAQGSAKLVQVNIASLLSSNIQPSAQSTKEFKALYNFNDSYFKKAEEAGKKVMLFLGTRVTTEPDFSDYARFAMSYYGDGYEYYYKGHPGTPTELYPNKQKQLDELGITDVDSSVAAELILFFNPQIFLSGYGSSTYASVPSSMAKGMFNMTKASGLSNPQYRDMDYWSSQVTSDASQAIRALTPSGHTCYLVEFSDAIAAGKGYDIAIWDATDLRIAYYKKDANGSYVPKGSSDGVAEKPAIDAGTYVIKSALADNKVLDVSGASKKDGGNVQLYSYNGTAAQIWHVTFDSKGRATIKNAASGKVLDAAGGKVVNGTNVQQYGSNGTGAQQWRIISNGDGTVRIVSALSSGVSVDVKHGSKVNGANVQLYASNSSKAQAFTFLATKPTVSKEGQAELADGFYRLSTAVDLSKCLDTKGWNGGNGDGIQISTANGGERQLFYISKQDSGFYRIENAWSGKALDVKGGSIMPGTAVQQWAGSASNRNELWAIWEQTGGSYTLQNVATGLLLDVKGGKTADGTGVQGYLANGSQAQRWLLASMPAPGVTLDEWASQNSDVLPNGTYVIQSGLADGLVLDVAGGSRNNSANVQLYGVNLSGAQKWRVTHDEKGYVTFTNLGSGKVLDVSGASKRRGANVQQYASNGTRAQKWIVVKDEKGGMAVVSALSRELGLDVNGTSAKAKANVQIYTRNGTNAQRFSFYRLVE